MVFIFVSAAGRVPQEREHGAVPVLQEDARGPARLLGGEAAEGEEQRGRVPEEHQ